MLYQLAQALGVDVFHLLDPDTSLNLVTQRVRRGLLQSDGVDQGLSVGRADYGRVERGIARLGEEDRRRLGRDPGTHHRATRAVNFRRGDRRLAVRVLIACPPPGRPPGRGLCAAEAPAGRPPSGYLPGGAATSTGSPRGLSSTIRGGRDGGHAPSQDARWRASRWLVRPVVAVVAESSLV